MTVLKISSDEKTILLPENIIDVSNGGLLTGKAVVINNGRITRLINHEEAHINSAKIISLSGLTLLPGLIDCHVHFALDGHSFQESIKRWENPELMEDKLQEELSNFLEYGVVAVRDGSDKAGIGLKAREISNNSSCMGPIVYASGFALRKEGYYGTFLGDGISNLGKIKDLIIKLAEKGVDQIKVLASGIVSFKQYEKVGAVQFTLSELKTIVDESHKLGLKVMAHASSDKAVEIATQAGVDSIEHGYFVSDSSLKLMAKKGTYWIPTVVPVHNQTLEPWKFSFTHEQIGIITKTYSLQLEKIRKASSLGVNLAVGTDAGAMAVPHGKAYYGELELYKKAGLSNLKIIQAATINGARLLGLEKDLGTIESGKLPYLIAVKGNPLEDLHVLVKVEATICPCR
jgi:imidazolonepropionase-like amidohydrolase